MENNMHKIKGKYNISLCGNYVVLFGDMLSIFNKDGSIVAHKKNLRNIHKIVAISEDSILADCGSPKAYVALSLSDGAEVWSLSHPRLDYTSRGFAIPPDNSAVYDYYDLKGSQYLLKIDLTTREMTTISLESGLRCISDLACDEKGTLCLLEHHYEIIGEKHISINGIRYVYEDSVCPGNAYNWKSKWAFDFPTISKFFLGNTDTVLTKDLFVYQPKTGKKYHLLENESRFELPECEPYDWKISSNKQYVILLYKDTNIVVDITTKKVVARYNTDFYHGCLIDDQYWVCLDDHIQIKPFPFFENIPASKPCFWYN